MRASCHRTYVDDVSWVERIVAIENKFLDRIRTGDAMRAATEPPTGTVDSLHGRKYCVLVTYKKNGDPIPSPLWFGVADGRIYAHTGGMKIKRIERNPDVRVAACTFRGTPTAAPFNGIARVLQPGQTEVAERALQSHYGWTRTVYYRLFNQQDLGSYIEVTPNS
jgi:PPOX class probable F420-dependent enzyme